jgi:hypothetical protein
MASYAAIAGTCEAIVRVLRTNFDPALFNGATLEFQAYVAEDFTKPMDEGVSVFLYRVYQNGSHRNIAGRILPSGKRQAPKLPIDLHFLLTAWAKTASLQNEIAGWMMRAMEDNTTLPPSLLNAYRAGVFGPEEGVEIGLTELSVEDMFRVWETMIGHAYQLSVPYVARMVEIESTVLEPITSVPIQERAPEYRRISA